MKKLFGLSVLMVSIIFSACGQKLDVSKVPAVVKTSFDKQFPGVKATWEKEDGNFEVNFKQNGHEMSALFDANGKMTESEMEINVSELPQTVLTYVNENYKSKKIKSAAKITNADGSINYEANVNGKDAIFSAEGKFIKVVKD